MSLPEIDRQLDRPAFLQIADALRERIDSGSFSPEDKLPSETQLMLHFDVARMTVRQALGVLAAEGLVEAKQGKGVFVRTPKNRDSSPQELILPMEEWSETVLRALSPSETPAWSLGAAKAFPWARAELGISDDHRLGRLTLYLKRSGTVFEVCSFYVLDAQARETARSQVEQAVKRAVSADIEIYSRAAKERDEKTFQEIAGEPLLVVRRTARDANLDVQFVSESLRVGVATLRLTASL